MCRSVLQYIAVYCSVFVEVCCSEFSRSSGRRYIRVRTYACLFASQEERVYVHVCVRAYVYACVCECVRVCLGACTLSCVLKYLHQDVYHRMHHTHGARVCMCARLISFLFTDKGTTTDADTTRILILLINSLHAHNIDILLQTLLCTLEETHRNTL